MSTVFESGMYISLKKEEYTVIENDIELFRTNADAPENRYKFTVNKFLNNVFVHMCDGRKFNESDVIRTRKKGAKGFNVKLNRNVNKKMIQAGLDPEKHYSAYFAAYYMQFVEEYCKLTLIEREKIFYRQLINDLKDEIYLNYFLKLKKNDGKYAYILPYSIEKSDDIHKNYITGFALTKTENGYVYNNTLCVPLNRILGYDRVERLDPVKRIAFEENSDIKSYEDMKKYIEDRFNTDGVLYLSDILRDVSVRLSDSGREMLLSRTQHRPKYEYNKENDHLIHFRATKLQTFMYFFKFGGDAEILKPKAYRTFFSDKYKEAYMLYKQQALN